MTLSITALRIMKLSIIIFSIDDTQHKRFLAQTTLCIITHTTVTPRIIIFINDTYHHKSINSFITTKLKAECRL